MATEGFEVAADGTVRITGPLTFDTVEEVRAAARAALGPDRWREQALTFDLAAVGRADSAGLALLVDWRRIAHREGGRVHFRGTPRSLRAIAGLSGVEGYLFE